MSNPLEEDLQFILNKFTDKERLELRDRVNRLRAALQPVDLEVIRREEPTTVGDRAWNCCIDEVQVRLSQHEAPVHINPYTKENPYKSGVLKSTDKAQTALDYLQDILAMYADDDLIEKLAPQISSLQEVIQQVKPLPNLKEAIDDIVDFMTVDKQQKPNYKSLFIVVNAAQRELKRQEKK